MKHISRVEFSVLVTLSAALLTAITAFAQEFDTAVSITMTADDRLADSQRAALAQGLQGDLNQMIGLANTSDGQGGYLFAGSQQSAPPFSESAAMRRCNPWWTPCTAISRTRSCSTVCASTRPCASSFRRYWASCGR